MHPFLGLRHNSNRTSTLKSCNVFTTADAAGKLTCGRGKIYKNCPMKLRQTDLDTSGNKKPRVKIAFKVFIKGLIGPYVYMYIIQDFILKISRHVLTVSQNVSIYILVCSVLDICVEANISKINKNKRFLNLTKRVQHTCSGISLQLF